VSDEVVPLEEVVPVETGAVRARSRPRAVLGMWAYESMLAIVGAWPAAALVRAAYGRSPQGDAALWDPGALPLLGLLTREANGVRAAAGGVAVVLVVAAFLGLVPLAALMVSLAYASVDGGRIGAARAIEGAVRVLRPFGRLLVIVLIGQGLVLLMAVLLGEGILGWTRGGLGEARSQQAGLLVGGAVGAFALVLAIAHDLGRAAVIRRNLQAVHALAVGTGILRRAPLSLGWAWAWRGSASLVPVAVVGAIATSLGGRGGWALVGLAALHQGVVFVRVALRASWLARALRAVDHFASDR
jgi:hypothetical protein